MENTNLFKQVSGTIRFDGTFWAEDAEHHTHTIEFVGTMADLWDTVQETALEMQESFEDVTVTATINGMRYTWTADNFKKELVA